MPGLSGGSFARLTGLAEAQAQMRALPKEAIEAFGIASEKTAKLIALQARAKAPIRKVPIGGYRGGALRERIGASLDASSGTSVVGIERGALVVTKTNNRVWVSRRRAGTREILLKSGKRKGQTAQSSYRMLLRQSERANLRGAGGVIIQPTKYGHFSELGRGGRSGSGAAHPWLRPAVEGSQDYFVDQMRAAAKGVETNLAQQGLKG